MKYAQSFIFFILFGILCTSHGFCEEMQRTDNTSHGEKIYVQPNQIFIESTGIFVNIANQWLITKSLCADTGGIYVNSNEPSVKWGWTCPKCKYENPWYANECKNCGYR